jgi:hypothetical protein
MKTVICHFYNEEFLLPWWLKHHGKIFDHGIMLDYASNDRSCDIIREMCPTWEIRPSRNQNFANSSKIDSEVMDIEKVLGGWRMCLNVTEFLYGNTDHLAILPDPTQYFVGNYVFVDMEDPTKGQVHLWHDVPLHQQRYWGYDEFANTGGVHGGIMGRMNRSIHNYPVTYNGGRHFGNATPQSFKDLVIFYYGWVDASESGIKRKSQITADRAGTGPHGYTDEAFLAMLRGTQRSLCRDLKSEIAHILEHNRRITGQEF